MENISRYNLKRKLLELPQKAREANPAQGHPMPKLNFAPPQDVVEISSKMKNTVAEKEGQTVKMLRRVRRMINHGILKAGQ